MRQLIAGLALVVGFTAQRIHAQGNSLPVRQDPQRVVDGKSAARLLRAGNLGDLTAVLTQRGPSQVSAQVRDEVADSAVAVALSLSGDAAALPLLRSIVLSLSTSGSTTSGIRYPGATMRLITIAKQVPRVAPLAIRGLLDVAPDGVLIPTLLELAESNDFHTAFGAIVALWDMSSGSGKRTLHDLYVTGREPKSEGAQTAIEQRASLERWKR